MKPQHNLRNILSTLLVLAFLVSPLESNETNSANDKRSFSIQLQADADRSSDQNIKIDFTTQVPVNNKKEKDGDHKIPDFLRHKRHADEDRHENHHHHFDKGKSRKKIINELSALSLKIIIAISYFSILLCSYMSICH